MRLKIIASITFLVIFITTTRTQDVVHVSSGHVRLFSNFSSRYVPARHVAVWLPENYNPHHRYAVLYMHDGQMLFDSAHTWNHQEWGVDETLTTLLHHKPELMSCIVVGIFNNSPKRHTEYAPQRPFEEMMTEHERRSLIANNKDAHVRLFQTMPTSNLYLKFIVEELKPFIDAYYPTQSDAQHTFIAGSSMGGLISLYALCEYPHIFGGAACMSTHWPGIFKADNPFPKAMLAYLKQYLPAPETHKIYFDIGTATLDSLYPPLQKQVDDLCLQKGYNKGQWWMSRVFVGEDHSERSWRRRLDIPFEFLLTEISPK